jgi:phosphoribosylamine---glycine ligase
VASGKAEVLAAVETCMEKRAFGAAGDVVVLEQALQGEELSVMALCSGGRLVPLPPSQDHKRAFDGDKGPNTGGMGAYSPVPAATEAVMARVKAEIFDRFLAGLAKDKLEYSGVIYFGLMLTQDGPKVLEFNTRFGDPETQVIVPLVDADWLELVLATAENRLHEVTVRPAAGAAVCVVMTSKGYPGDYPKGLPISGLDRAEHPDTVVFHAGTKGHGTGQVITAGGRVLGVTALGRDLASARQKAYEAVEKIAFDGAHFRKDIAAKAL